MKRLTVALVLVFIAICVSTDQEKWTKIAEECKTEVGLEKVPLANFTNNFENPKVKCFYACAMKKSGELLDGKVNPDKSFEILRGMLPNINETTKNNLKECAKTANKKEEDCDIAAEYTKCCFESLKNILNAIKKNE